MNNKPYFSILLCVYNGEEFIANAVNSLLEQEFSDWELVVVNDGSTDSTENILQEYSKKDSRVKVFSKENTGLTHSLNYGLGFCNGQWIVRHDADDTSTPNRLSEIYRVVTTNNYEFVYSQSYFKCEKNTRIQPSFIYEHSFNCNILKYGNHIIHGSIAIKKELIELVKYDQSFLVAQDFNLYARLSKLGIKSKMICRPLYTVNLSEQSISSRRSVEQNESVRRTLQEVLGTDCYMDNNNKPLTKIIKLIKVSFYYIKGGLLS